MSESTPVASKPAHWRTGLRPLIWWVILVLLMFAYRTHERLSENTRLGFEPTLAGKPVAGEAAAIIDGKSVGDGQRISIGWHKLTVNHPKAKPFTTNLFIWYGPRDLGEIALERTTGVLAIAASPTAQRLIVRGPEFTVSLTNTSGMTSSVPTDRYVVEAAYKYWNRRDELSVLADQRAACSFAPELGTLHIEANYPDASYQLRNDRQALIEAGQLPAIINELPAGSYRLIASRKTDQEELTVSVKSDTTNSTKVEFTYGAMTFLSDPPGATIRLDGQVIMGVTPVTLAELPAGEREFSLVLDDYQGVTAKVTVVANQTNSFQTNLISRRYMQAMEQARRSFARKEFNQAAAAAEEALEHKPRDESATRLEREAAGQEHLSKAGALGQRGDFALAIRHINTALSLLSNSAPAQALLADFTKREQERTDAEKRRSAELKAQADKRNLEQAIANFRQVRLDLLKDTFGQWCQKLPNHLMYAEHELSISNAIKNIATPINNALASDLPKFEIIKYEWPNDNTFVSVGSQSVIGGTRMCVVMASEVQTNETCIRFKVFEYDNPPELKLLGVLLRVSAQITTTAPPTPAQLNARAEKFAARVKEGIKMVRDRIRSASEIPLGVN